MHSKADLGQGSLILLACLVLGILIFFSSLETLVIQTIVDPDIFGWFSMGFNTPEIKPYASGLEPLPMANFFSVVHAVSS